MSSKLPKLVKRFDGKIPGSGTRSNHQKLAHVTAGQLLEKRAEAEFACKNLEDNIKIAEQKIKTLLQMKVLEDAAFEESYIKRAMLMARSSLSYNQSKTCRDVKERAKTITTNLSSNVVEEVSSPAQSFIFNPSAKNLESSMKSSLKRCLESDGELMSPKVILDMVTKYSCKERLKHIMDIQNEVKHEVSKFVESINVEEDAQKLSKALEKLEIGLVALTPLEQHIKEFTLQNAQMVLVEQDLINENKRLERELQELLQNNPDMTSNVQKLMAAEQSAVLHFHLESLNEGNQNFQKNESEKARMLKKISVLLKELEELRFCVMKDLSSMESILTHQQNLVDDMLEIGKSSEDFGEMLEIEKCVQTLISNIYSMSLKPTTVNVNLAAPQEIIESSDMKALFRQLQLLQTHEVENLQKQTEALEQFKGEMSKLNETLQKDAALVLKSVCEAQNLYLDRASASKDFVEKLDSCKENFVEKKLAIDSARIGSDLTLQEWIDHFTESFPEINCISE
ncbi:Hypothetical predicted protein [Cloeon dipterum]|nr:Hypothetical predicted protein [Cloeon dipterum]